MGISLFDDIDGISYSSPHMFNTKLITVKLVISYKASNIDHSYLGQESQHTIELLVTKSFIRISIELVICPYVDE